MFSLQGEGSLRTIRITLPCGRTGDQLVAEAVRELDEFQLPEGLQALTVDGPSTVAMAYAIAHFLAHRVREVRVNDPKLPGPLTVISHGGSPVGTVTPR